MLEKMKVVIAGQKRFGREVAHLVATRYGWEIAAVSCPVKPGAGGQPLAASEQLDKLHIYALNHHLPIIPAGQLTSERIPAGVDLIVAAHCHDFLSRKVRHRARLGALGYHPSLLPRHRGRSAVEWAIRFREMVTGGTVYWMNDTLDGGPVAAQKPVFIREHDTARELWVRELAPLGLALFERVFDELDRGIITRQKQNHALATWEPSIEGVPPLHRPELELLPWTP